MYYSWPFPITLEYSFSVGFLVVTCHFIDNLTNNLNKRSYRITCKCVLLLCRPGTEYYCPRRQLLAMICNPMHILIYICIACLGIVTPSITPHTLYKHWYWHIVETVVVMLLAPTPNNHNL